MENTEKSAIKRIGIDKKDILLIFPPHWAFNMPYLSLPCLHGALKAAGFDATLIDLNLEFHCWLFSATGMAFFEDRIRRRIDHFNSQNRLNSKDIGICRQLLCAIPTVKSLRAEIDSASKVLRSAEFYSPNSLIETFNLLNKAYEVASAAYAPSKINFVSFDSPHDCSFPAGLEAAVADHGTNLYLDYYENITIPYVKGLSPKIIGISISSETQWLPAITLGYVLRRAGFDGQIIVGGGIPTRLGTTLSYIETSLMNYCDVVVLGQGEETIVEIAGAFSKNANFDDVPNIIRYERAGVFVSHRKKPRPYRDLPMPVFEALPLERYLSPVPVLPVMIARGCYNQCSFCDHSGAFEQKRSAKSIQSIVNELKYIHSRHNVSNIAFADESLSPKMSFELSNVLEREGLKLNMASCFRLEETWTKDIWHKVSECGFRLGQFGLESASDKVLQVMNKGIRAITAARVLKEANEAGLWNHVFIMFGFPSETREEANETNNYVLKHSDKIHSTGASQFHLMRHTPIFKNPDKYFISYSDINPWSLVIPYKLNNGNSVEISGRIVSDFNDVISISMKGAFLWKRLERSQLLLYLNRYGRDKVLEMGSQLRDKYVNKDAEPNLPIDVDLRRFNHDVTLDVQQINKLNNVSVPVNKGVALFTSIRRRAVSLLNDEAAWIISAWREGRTVDYIIEQLNKRYHLQKGLLYSDCSKFLKSLSLYVRDSEECAIEFDPKIGTIESAIRLGIDLFRNRVQAPKSLPVEALPEWIAVNNGLKPGLRTVLYGIDKASLSTLYNELRQKGMHAHFRKASPRGFAHLSPGERRMALATNPIIAYVAKSSRRASHLHKAEKQGSRALGQALGYPECCISWLEELDGQTRHDNRPCNFPIMSVRNTDGKFAAELNNLLWCLPTIESPFYLISHYPCSYGCCSSVEQSHSLYSLLKKMYPEFAISLKQLLCRPIVLWDDTKLQERQWDENKGLILNGCSRKGIIYYKDYISLRRPRDYTELSLPYANMLMIRSNYVATFREDKIAGCWWNAVHGDPYILNFNWTRDDT
jgi:anaerobic magnesium-protoporphyrin IX monomethyl ester cyclase